MTIQSLPHYLQVSSVKKIKAFWLSNLLGWSVYFFVNFLLLFEQQDWFYFSLLQTSLRIVAMFMFCLLFRFLLLTRQWHTLPIIQFMFLSLVFSVVTGAIANGLAMLLNRQLAIFTLPQTIYDAVIAEPVLRNIVAEFLWSSISTLFIMLTWTIGYGLTRLYTLNKNTEIENLKLQNALRDAEMDSLKAQINPHFLLNTLNNLRSMIRQQHPESVNIVTSISEVLKYSLSNHHKDKVQLHQEIEIVENVIAIAKLQLGERLVFNLQIKQDLTNALVPPFSIQLLVENAIKHGIEKRKAGGHVTVSICSMRDNSLSGTLCVEVKNTGSLDKTSSDITSVGLLNLRKRLDILYAAQASFTLVQDKDEVVANIRQPLEYAS